MEDPRRPWWQRVPWWVWGLFAIALIGGVLFAILARGPAVEEVALSAAQLTVLRRL